MAGVTKYIGADAMMAKLAKLQKFAPDEFARALKEETKPEVNECKKETPVEEGDLRDGIHMEGPFREGRRIYTQIVTDPKQDDYALKVHEDLEAFHTVGGAKYIERPLNASAPHMAERIAKRIDLNKAL
jgi:bacteriophage HK97-gp10 putative tail-component